MSLSQLPYDILHKILSISTRHTAIHPMSWKVQLGYIAVNRTWRHIALPMVYCKATACCETDYEVIGAENYVNSELDTLDIPEKWITNVDLMISNRMTRHAKDMYITLSTDMGVLYFINELFERLQLDRIDWASVNKLDFQICNVTADNDETHEQTASELGLLFSQYFPSIKQLRCAAQKDDHLSTAFTNTLVSCYANTIAKYETLFSTPTSCPVFGRQLTHLEIAQCCHATKELIYIHASSIKYLALNQLTFDFELINYSTNSPGQVVFANLETWILTYNKPVGLSLEQRQELLNNQNRCKVVAPKLKELAVHNYLSLFPLKFATSAFRLKHCRISCSTVAAQLFIEVKFPNLKDLNLTLYRDESADDEPDIVATVNNILDNARPSDSCAISLHCSLAGINPKNMKWSRITRFSASSSISFENMVKVLKEIPNATDVSFDSLNINGAGALDFVQKHSKVNGVQQRCILPLHSKAQHIRFVVEKKGCPPDHAQAMQECIEQCFPSRKSFNYYIPK
ncbi:hypothetical protein BX667DRAFT_523280 [Coemansia mojavensis]|nr:hypothetical protein BX667DRAFT_523280 [Coemansia mojavensis]